MPFDQWYDDATREAATARVLQRRMTNPTDRNVLTVVAEEFSVPRQTLSDWVDEASPESARPQRKPRPKFSQVVRSTKEARVEPPTDDEVDETPTPVEVEVVVEQAEPTAHAGSDESAGSDEPAAQDEPAESAAPAEPAESAAPAEPEPDPAPDADPEPVPAPAPTEPAAVPAPAPAPPAAAPADRRLSALEAEVAALRAGNRALVEALRVLVDD